MAESAKEKPTKSKKPLLIAVVVLLLAGGAGGFFLLGPGKAEAQEEGHGHNADGSHELGSVVRLKPVVTNLSDGHVLKVGLALQMIAEPKNKELAALVAHGGGESGGAVDASSPMGGAEAKALDAAIHTLGDGTHEELSKAGVKQKFKDDLAVELVKRYEGDVVDVYYTDFVMS